MITIENEYLRISVQKQGAELCSIYSKSSKTEYMWDANPDIWGSYAPVLFPIIGALKDGEYYYNGKSYRIPKHGFIRSNPNLSHRIIENHTIEFQYHSSEETLKMYPFSFAFFIRFHLCGNSISVEHTIKNLSTSDVLYYSLGGHPAFRCPFFPEENYADYFIEFEQEETEPTWKVLGNGLIDTQTKPLLKQSKQLTLTPTLFSEDALILKNLQSKSVRLTSKNHNNYIQVDFPDFEYLGLWAKPNSSFVCIEPWLGISDSITTDKEFSSKEGIQILPANSQHEKQFVIRICEE
jgi:galactose mutarotase-like enzyme